MSLSLERRVRRLEAFFLPATPEPRETENDRRARQLVDDLLGRIDPESAAAIKKEGDLLTKEWQAGRDPAMSSLYLGFSVTVLGHIERNAPLEFPTIVARAYVQNNGWDYVECSSCRYRFPPAVGEARFQQCPVCKSAVAPYLGFKRGAKKV